MLERVLVGFQTAIHMLGIKTKGIKNHPSGRVFTHFWGCHQRFFRQLCMAVKVPEVVKIAQQALLANKCVVIGLQTTGEARLNDAVKGGADLEEFAGMKEVIKFLLSKFRAPTRLPSDGPRLAHHSLSLLAPRMRASHGRLHGQASRGRPLGRRRGRGG